MIRPLRQVHRLAIPALLFAVVPALTVALLKRPPAPPIESAVTAASLRVLPAAAGHRKIEIRLPADLPEVLAYWAPESQDTVDAKAVLIGPAAAPTSVLDLPGDLGEGQVLLYALPLKQVIARQPLPAGAAP